MNKRLYFKNHISFCISIYDFQNLSKSSSFVLMASHCFYVKKDHSINHFNKYDDFIYTWYGLWCKVFSI
jgi:hypothetical protein